jgi:hypothetical protein
MQRKLLKSIEGDSMEEIKNWIARCENANIAPDDSDLEYARRKLEVVTEDILSYDILDSFTVF